MRDYIITTDNNADLTDSFYEEHQVGWVSLTYNLEGETYSKDNSLPVHEFYEKMRNGSMPTTSQVNPENARALFEPILKEGKNILHIAFSSGLSGSYNSARLAALELMEIYPEAKIQVVDSLCASLGQGLLVYRAVELKEQHKSLEEVTEWLLDNRLQLCHIFTVDDLNHLHRGGRVSKMTAIVGTMINIKPILHVDNEGKLIPIGKTRGRKKSLQELVNYMEKQCKDCKEENDIVFISHGDCLEDALFVKNQIEERYGIKKFLINQIGPMIGAHSGPGTVALFFMGQSR